METIQPTQTPEIIYIEIVKYVTYTEAQKRAILKYHSKPEVREKRRLYAQKRYAEKKAAKLMAAEI